MGRFYRLPCIFILSLGSQLHGLLGQDNETLDPVLCYRDESSENVTCESHSRTSLESTSY